jgi:hypothetical protein
MPPVNSAQMRGLQELGSQLGVAIVAPLTERELQPGDYDVDQYHLSSQGRLRFTRALTHDLLEILQ